MGRTIEWPKGSGVTADYERHEEQLVRDLLGQHDAGEITGAEFKTQMDVIHDLKVMLDGRILPDADVEQVEAGPMQGSFFQAPASVLDPNAARVATAEGIARVDRGTDPSWRDRAKAVLTQLCEELDFFTPDDIWTRIEKPQEPRALGPVMMWATREGLCEWTGELVKSQVPTQHQNHIRRYRSLRRSS